MILLLIMLFLPEGIFSGLRGGLARVFAVFKKPRQTSLEREPVVQASVGKPLGSPSGHDQ
jgi:hypothetical protein